MDLGLTGKQALVLGASRGLGAAVAQALALEGATVLASGRSPDGVLAWRQTLPAEAAARVHTVAADLSDCAQVDALAAQADAFGPTDILINNGGGPPPGVASGVKTEQWVSSFQTMAAHLFHLTGLLLPGMTARGFGRIITIASSGVEQPIPNLAISNAVRSSIVGWSKTLSAEVAAQGVTVNVVIPGRIHTDRVDQLDGVAAEKQGKSREEIAQASRATIPMARYGRPEEFADVVAFLASAKASYITGAKIRVDGGMIRSI
jgi:3-oxoacyl-[acyl-carrier protein] reductase